MTDFLPGVAYGEFVAEALRHPTLASFRSSSFYQSHEQDLRNLFSNPRIDTFPGPEAESATLRTAAPAPHASAGGSAQRVESGEIPSLRVVHWNIEKGKKLDGLKRYLSQDPFFQSAHLFCLNEVDLGMARSGCNADVTRELAGSLGCDAVFIPSYIECTKGPAEEALAPGENACGLHGLAVLSRIPILDARVHLLPECWDYFGFHEKRLGQRQGLYVRLAWQGRSIAVATTHLEVRWTPRCRARQFRAFLDGLEEAGEAWGGPLPTVLTGDWNTNTFRRGGRLHSTREFFRILLSRRHRLNAHLIQPFRFEPLFEHLRRAGFQVDPFNDDQPTATQALGKVEDLALLPPWTAEILLRVSRLSGRVFEMRLDWIAARGFRAAGPPRTLPPGPSPQEPLSDHAPISADLTLTS